MKVKIFRTDKQGTIIVMSDGSRLSFNLQPLEISYQKKNNNKNKAVKIISLDLKNEVVVIKNTGNETINLAGWKLVSLKGNQQFNFPDNTVLKPGQSFKILSGPSALNKPDNIIWTRSNIWNNSGDGALLTDSNGEIIDRLLREED